MAVIAASAQMLKRGLIFKLKAEKILPGAFTPD